MKASISTLVAIVTFASSTAVFAQTYIDAPTPQRPQQAQTQTQTQARQNPTGTQAPQWVAPDTAYVGKTRAQVYAELVQAQRDGQIAYLNKTVYAHH
ncbi:DUF4148 domain-containing protein [Paraburkholderia sp. SARCC-3016]|uniref:DUF4148 domain-containing protein n=1 Tax=Paraburkholderia sp. SARCC-3016 TaxID=3058611 RepID=UPI002806A2C5|nr:DUF4148 domain-containing protein [Paraburkholderia sp. SARCC-3016]MDQ7976255.1 DUF4148 domain-containing protein [Paraburkholderia sp. SARCC-3016]